MSSLEDWLGPWMPIGEGSGVLRKNLSTRFFQRHPLCRRTAAAIGRRIDNDAALFEFEDGTRQYAVVHLTWRKERSAEWPWTKFFDDLKSWRRDCMIPDSPEYTQSPGQEWSRGQLGRY